MLFLFLAGVLFTASQLKAAEVTPKEAEAIINELKASGGAVQPIGMTNDTYAQYFHRTELPN